MITNTNRQNAHKKIDHIFKDLLPANGMAERPEQLALSHRMLDTMLEGGIALCDAGTGIGKTYAYLVAGTVYSRCRATGGLTFQPIIISTSSIALQNAVLNEYLPFLSAVLMADGQLDEPLRAVIRKGKSHYVCDDLLEKRLRNINLQKKNRQAAEALLSLRHHLDMDKAEHLSGFDRERVCVPLVCACAKDDCRYHHFLENCDDQRYLFQICNHNLLLADAIHRSGGKKAILPDSCAVIMDEAHKLPEVARQMFGVMLKAEDIHNLTLGLRAEKYILAAESLADACAPLVEKMSIPAEDAEPFENYARLMTAPLKMLTIIQRQLRDLLTPLTRRMAERMLSAVTLFAQGDPAMVFYTADDGSGGTMLCATASDLTAQLRGVLWDQRRPIILTSGTLAVGSDFRRFREETGLATENRVTESVFLSPFDYKRNCLLYLPQRPPKQLDENENAYYSQLTDEIAALLDAACGHALVLFTSYSSMSAVKERLAQKEMNYSLITMGRSTVHTAEQFRAKPGSVLLATGAAWEGFDFPGDCVSLLIIPRLPFAYPDAMKEKERENYETIRAFIRAVVVPDMQIKLKQGFGRAIRTETDTCVVAILDERAARGRRYFNDVREALPEIRLTSSLNAVERFIRSVKPEGYFTEGCA